MNVGELLERLLTHFSPEERSIPNSGDYPGRNESALGAINSAMQTLFGSTSPWCRRDFEGAWLHAPETISVTVTEGEKSITIPSWTDWMAGCTLRIAGASVDNRIHGIDPETDDISLVLPHDGDSGTVNATIYNDCITLLDHVAEVLKPVQIRGQGFLSPVGAPSELTDPSPDYEDYDIHEHNVTHYFPRESSQTMGIPKRYCVDTHQHSIYTTPKARLRIFPAPASRMLLEYRIRYAVPVYTLNDLALVLPIPLQYEESILVPTAQQALTRSAFFRDEPAKQAIADAYQTALDLLRSMNPQGTSGGRMIAQF